MNAFIGILALIGTLVAVPVAAQQTGTATQVTDAANVFLASLTDEQRVQVLYDFSDETQRARWSNFPTGVVPRGGVSLRQMSASQRDAAMRMLALVLSPMGLKKVNQIRQADDDFKTGGSRRGPGGRGGPPPGKEGPDRRPAGGAGSRPTFSSDNLFGSDLYYFSFLGRPSTSHAWMLQFGGHHLALNVTIAGDNDILTPTLTGAQPARFTLNGQTIRPLGHESDKALALMQALDEPQRKRAVLGYSVSDLVLGPGEDGKTIAPEGLKASEMTAAQRAMLMDVVAEWVGMVNDNAASARMAQIKAELDDIWLAWSGPTTGTAASNITAYYRIQGPHVVIEYAPQGDEPDNHVHTIYRDPTDDYGRSSAKLLMNR